MDCYAFGVPDERVGEEVGIWIKLIPNVEMTEDEVKEFCDGNIARFKIPKYIRFVDAFPTSATGKVQKFKMQDEMKKELGIKK
jgi:fatty-acyl-CoA synthase